MILDSTMQLTFKELPRVQFWCSIVIEYLELSEKTNRILLFQQRIFQKNTYNRLNAEADVRI